MSRNRMFSEEGWFRPRNTFIPLKEIEKKNLLVTQPMGAQSETTGNITFCYLDLQLSFFVYFRSFESFCNEPFVKQKKTNYSWLRYL